MAELRLSQWTWLLLMSSFAVLDTLVIGLYKGIYISTFVGIAIGGMLVLWACVRDVHGTPALRSMFLVWAAWIVWGLATSQLLPFEKGDALFYSRETILAVAALALLCPLPLQPYGQYVALTILVGASLIPEVTSSVLIWMPWMSVVRVGIFFGLVIWATDGAQRYDTAPDTDHFLESVLAVGRCIFILTSNWYFVGPLFLIYVIWYTWLRRFVKTIVSHRVVWEAAKKDLAKEKATNSEMITKKRWNPFNRTVKRVKLS